MDKREEYNRYIIWGAYGEVCGKIINAKAAAKLLFEFLKKQGEQEKIICWVDSAEEKWGKTIYRKKICRPEMIKEYPDALIIINTISYWEVKRSLIDMDIKNDCRIIPFYWYSGTAQFPYDISLAKKHMLENKKQIISLFQMDDTETKAQMELLCSFREKGRDDLYTFDDYGQTGKKKDYFCDDRLSPKGNVTFIDIGAYCGETILPVEKFYRERLKEVIAFEPDEFARKKLKEYANANSFNYTMNIFEYALSNKNETAYFKLGQATSALADYGETKVECRRFDDLNDINLIGESMIKMDIEGAELDALKGMANFVKEKQPYLVICLYHKVTDLLDIPLYLKSLYPGYRLYFRGGWHLECWAVPERHFKITQ